MTRPAEILSANKNEMAAGGSGTTSIANTRRITMGPESCDRLKPPSRGRTAVSAMQQSRNRVQQTGSVIVHTTKHHWPARGHKSGHPSQLQYKRNGRFPH